MVEVAGAAFMVILNEGLEDDALVGASSPAAAIVELHQTTEQDDGTLAMAPVAEIPVAAGGSAVLEPGGYHIMLFELVEPLAVGQSIDLDLEFASGASGTISLPIRALGPMSATDDDDADDAEDSDDAEDGEEDGDSEDDDD